MKTTIRHMKEAAAMSAENRQNSDPQSTAGKVGMFIVRYGIGIAMVTAGVVMLIASPAGLGVDGFAMAVGGGLSVLMINFLFRLGAQGDLERDKEEEARRYLEVHGEWPQDEPPTKKRMWHLAPGVVTLEQEQAERRLPGAV
jgi:hypothetical protein